MEIAQIHPVGETACLGMWKPGAAPPAFRPVDVGAVASRFRETTHVLQDPATGGVGVGLGGEVFHGRAASGDGPYRHLGTLPPLYPEWLGDRAFLEAHGLRFPYLAGEMANGIATPALVIAMARAGMMGFFGAGGLALEDVERGLHQIAVALEGQGLPWGTNLIHAPAEPELEEATVDLYLRRGIRRVSASAYMTLTPAVVRYACSGLRADGQGRLRRQNHLFAKVSRPEVAKLFLSPAPGSMLEALVRAGRLTREEAALATRLPLAEDVTVEADSGGHTDNRPLGVLLPAILDLRDEISAQHEYPRPIRVGAAGGLGAPGAVAAAFAGGAAYVLTGSVNQAALESGLSTEGKRMLAEAGLADVTMAPSPDMFELGVKVQVLKRGTLFSARASMLRDLYLAHASLEAIPAAARDRLEREIFRASLDEVWADTRAYFLRRSPRELERAERDPKHRMALVFRWYLGKASRWAIEGETSRRLDFQIWCGPAMGAFNAWVAGSFLGDPDRRTVEQIAKNLLEGAAVITRAHQLRSYGVPVPAQAFRFRPRPLA
jgi:PfaD family protein